MQKYGALAIGYLLAYIVLHWITFFSEYSDIGVTPWNPETGLAFALAWLAGPIAAPLSFVANFAGAMITGSYVEFGPLALRSLTYTAVYTTAGLVLRSSYPESKVLTARFIVLLLLVATLSAAGFAVLWLSSLAALGVLAVERFYSAIFTAATGDLIGILTIAPLIFLLARNEISLEWVKQNALAFVIATLAIVIIAYGVFGLDITDQFKVFYLVFIPVIALAMRFGIGGAVFGIVLSDVAMMVTIFVRDVSVVTATELQVLMISLSATGLLLGSVVSERSRLAAELHRSTTRLQDALAALQHASRVMLVNELASAIAHELNQPLSAIRNFVRAIQRLLSEPRVDRTRLAELSAMAVREVDSVSEIILETKQFLKKDISTPANSDLRDAVGICIRMLQSELRRTGTSLRLDIPERLPPLRIDSVRLQQLVLNLLRNALDAVLEQTAGTRMIAITATTHRPASVEVAIEDSGAGIAQEIRDRLFQPFVTSKANGLGLGLSLCRSIVEDHGGELKLDESATATRFVITLPAGRKLQT